MDSRLSPAMSAAAVATDSGLPEPQAGYSAPEPSLARHWQAVPDLFARAGFLVLAVLLPAVVAAGWFRALVATWKDSSAVRTAKARSTVRQSIRYSGFA